MMSTGKLFALVASAAVFATGPALAQKQGGTMTVGLELDIPGFDPLKVGVYDTAAVTAAGLLFETMTTLDNDGKAGRGIAGVVEPD